ncbi:MAG TPA: hypothetical protein VF450_10185 [Noviherbaspirillum sp.]
MLAEYLYNFLVLFGFVVFLASALVVEALVKAYLRHQVAVQQRLWKVRFAVVSRWKATSIWANAKKAKLSRMFEKHVLPKMRHE